MFRFLSLLLVCLASRRQVPGFVPLVQQRRVSSLLRLPFRHLLDDPAKTASSSSSSSGANPFSPPPSLLEGNSMKETIPKTPVWQTTSDQVFGTAGHHVVFKINNEETTSTILSHDATTRTETANSSWPQSEQVPLTLNSQSQNGMSIPARKRLSEEMTTTPPTRQSRAAATLAARAKLIPLMSLMDLLARLDKYRIPYSAWATRAQLEHLLIQYEQEGYNRAAVITSR